MDCDPPQLGHLDPGSPQLGAGGVGAAGRGVGGDDTPTPGIWGGGGHTHRDTSRALPLPAGALRSEAGAGGSSRSPLLRSEPGDDPTSLEFEEFPAKALGKTRESEKKPRLTLRSPRPPSAACLSFPAAALPPPPRPPAAAPAPGRHPATPGTPRDPRPPRETTLGPGQGGFGTPRAPPGCGMELPAGQDGVGTPRSAG